MVVYLNVKADMQMCCLGAIFSQFIIMFFALLFLIIYVLCKKVSVRPP